MQSAIVPMLSASRRDPAVERKVPLWRSLRSWWIVVPLLYFSTMGEFIVEESSSVIATKPGASSLDRMEQALIWLIAILVMAPRFRIAMSAVYKHKTLSAIAALACVSVLWSPSPADSARRAALLCLTFLFGYFIAETFEPGQQMRLILGTGCVAVLLSVGLVIALPRYGLTYVGEWRGIFSSKADLGMYLCFLFSPVPFIKSKGLLARGCGAVCIVLCGLSIIMSQSRGGWILASAFIAYSCFVRVIRNFGSADAVSIATLSLIVGGLVAWIGYLNFSSFTYLIGKDPSLTNRTLIWNAVWTAIVKRPILGYGYGGFWNGYQSESYNVVASVGTVITHAHDGFLNVWVQIGVVGLGLFIVTTLQAFIDAIKGFVVYRCDATLWYFGILLLTLVGSIDESFLLNYNALTTIMYIVACVGLRKIAKGQAGNAA